MLIYNVLILTGKGLYCNETTHTSTTTPPWTTRKDTLSTSTVQTYSTTPYTTTTETPEIPSVSCNFSKSVCGYTSTADIGNTTWRWGEARFNSQLPADHTSGVTDNEDGKLRNVV